MGLSASQGRLLDLTVRKDFYSFNIQQIDEERIEIANETEKLFQQEELQSNNQAYNVSFNDICNYAGKSIYNTITNCNLNSRNILANLNNIFSGNNNNNSNNNTALKIYELEDQDKKLQMRLNIDNTQYKGTVKEMQVVNKEINEDIKSTFNVLG